MLALVVCGNHWYGLLSSASPIASEYLSTLTERKYTSMICYFNLKTSEKDDSGTEY